MAIALYILAARLIVGGLAGAVLPALPGIPMLFGGIWLAAAVDDYQHLGLWWLLIIGVLGGIGVTVDFVASALGAKRVGASKLALWGAALRSEEHTSELQSLMRISYAVFCLKKKIHSNTYKKQ